MFGFFAKDSRSGRHNLGRRHAREHVRGLGSSKLHQRLHQWLHRHADGARYAQILEMNPDHCPGCDKHCPLSAPGCDKGEAFAAQRHTEQKGN